MLTRKATMEDCRSIAELALIAGEGMPAYFWGQSKSENQEIENVGALNAASETENFSYKNVQLVPARVTRGQVLSGSRNSVVSL